MKGMRMFLLLAPLVAGVSLLNSSGHIVLASEPTYDVTTFAGKVASLNGTAGLQIRFSALIEQEAEVDQSNPAPSTPITPRDFCTGGS